MATNISRTVKWRTYCTASIKFSAPTENTLWAVAGGLHSSDGDRAHNDVPLMWLLECQPMNREKLKHWGLLMVWSPCTSDQPFGQQKYPNSGHSCHFVSFPCPRQRCQFQDPCYERRTEAMTGEELCTLTNMALSSTLRTIKVWGYGRYGDGFWRCNLVGIFHQISSVFIYPWHPIGISSQQKKYPCWFSFVSNDVSNAGGPMVVNGMGGCLVTPLSPRSAGTDRTPGGDQFEYAEVVLLGWPGGWQ